MRAKPTCGREPSRSRYPLLLPGFVGLLFMCCLAETARSQELKPEESKRIDDSLKVLRSDDAEWGDLSGAVSDLKGMKSPAARARLLAEARKAKEENVLYWLCRALVETEPAGVASILTEQIERSVESLPPHLVELLGETGDRRAVKPLVSIVGSSSPLAPRARALTALAGIDDPEARKTIFEALDDEDYYARKAAGEAVVRLASGSEETVGRADEVAALLVDRIEKSEGRRAAYFIGLLAKAGGDTAEGAVTGYLLSGDDDVLEAAIRAAGTLKAKRAADILLGIALDDRRPVRIRELAMEALAYVGAGRGAAERLDELVPLLESENARVKSGAHKALQRLTRRKLPLAVGVWETAARRFEEDREFGPVLEPELEALPVAVRPASPMARAYREPRAPPALLYVIIVLSGIALVVALVLLRPALRRRAAKAIRSRRQRRISRHPRGR